jgi:hypothetical protein
LVADLDQIYREIKDVESLSPIPAPSTAVNVGMFDAASGRFTFSSAVRRETKTEVVGPGKVIRTTTFSVRVNVVNLTLRFTVTNSQGNFTVKANGSAAAAAPGQSTVGVDVARASDVDFTVSSGASTFSEQLTIVRPPLIGAGAFRLPTLPVLVLYDPPPDQGKQNTATYSQVRSLGVSTTLSFSSRQELEADFLSPAQLAKRWSDSLSVVLAGAEGFYAGQANAQAGIDSYTDPVTELIRALPSGSSGTKEITEDTSDQTLDTQITATTTIETQGQLGPGRGDLVAYMSNVRLSWGALNGEVFLSLLGWDRLVLASANSIRDEIRMLNNTIAGGGTPKAATSNLGTLVTSLQALLSLDPFTANASLRGDPRFAGPADDPNLLTIELRGPARFSEEVSHSVTEQDKTERVDTRVETEDESAGFLSILLPFLGDPTKNSSLETRIINTSSKEVSVGRDLRVTVDLHAAVGESYAVSLYFDRVFGTFALERLALRATPLVSGQARGPKGQPLTSEVVTLLAGGERFLTTTDQQGSFAFSTDTIKPGMLTVETRAARQNVDFTSGKPVLNVVLGGPGGFAAQSTAND